MKLRYLIPLVLLLDLLPATLAQQKQLRKGTYAHFETSLGTFTAELETKLAPRTVENFIGLATGTKSWKDPMTGQMVSGKPYYTDMIFHRVVGDYLIQSGDPTGTGSGGPGFTIPDEFNAQLIHDRPGIL